MTYTDALPADPEPAHTLTLGQLGLRVFPDRNWIILSRKHNETVYSLGINGDDLADCFALLRTAGDWLASQVG